MKTIKSVLIILLAICPNITYGQETIQGSGHRETQKRETAGFSDIKVSLGIKVVMTPGKLQPLTVEADDNLFPYIITEVKNNVLNIYLKDGISIKKFADINVFITLPGFSKLEASTAARIEGITQAWKCDKIQLRTNTAAQIKLHIESNETTVEAETASQMELKGTTGKLKAEIETAAKLNAKELKTGDADIEINTSGIAAIEVTNEIKYNLSTCAKLIYKGDPRILEAEISTGAKIMKEK